MTRAPSIAPCLTFELDFYRKSAHSQRVMKKGGGAIKPVLLSIIALAFVPRLLAAQDPFLTLDMVVQTNGQLQFNLNGEDSVTYGIEGSSDLHNWTPVLTTSGQPAIRTITVDDSQNFGFYRAIRGPLPYFAAAITARSNITFNGNYITTDSYDASDTNDFPGGLWNAMHRMDHGDVAVANSSISIGNAGIMGKVWIEGGTIVGVVNGMGPEGSVGDVAYVTSGSTGIENPFSNFVSDDFRFCLPDVLVPYTSGAAISPPTAGKTNTLSTGMYYYNGDFSIPNNADLQVAPYSSIALYVTGSFSMTSLAKIDIQPGGTLVLYVGGSSASFTTINNSGNDINFQYYGLPGNTSVRLAGNVSYLATIYAPEANITVSSGGTNPMDFEGALVGSSFLLNGHINVHYDENLVRVGPQR